MKLIIEIDLERVKFQQGAPHPVARIMQGIDSYLLDVAFALRGSRTREAFLAAFVDRLDIEAESGVRIGSARIEGAWASARYVVHGRTSEGVWSASGRNVPFRVYDTIARRGLQGRYDTWSEAESAIARIEGELAKAAE